MKRNVLMPDFAKRGGVIPVVVQDAKTGAVLSLVYTNEDCFLETLETGEAVYWSTSKQRRHKKGEERGNIQQVCQILIDCDEDALVYIVQQVGTGACHRGAYSCFFRSIMGRECDRRGPDNIHISPQKEQEVHERISADDLSLALAGPLFPAKMLQTGERP